MKSFNKILLLTVLGFGAYVSEIKADAEIQTKIHKAIEAKIANLGTKPTSNEKESQAALVKILTEIKVDLLEILQSAPDTPQYKKLKTAVDQLKPANMLAMIGHIKTILANIDEKTKALILQQIPEKFHSFVK